MPVVPCVRPSQGSVQAPANGVARELKSLRATPFAGACTDPCRRPDAAATALLLIATMAADALWRG